MNIPPTSGVTPTEKTGPQQTSQAYTAEGILDNLEELTMHGHMTLGVNLQQRQMISPHPESRINLGLLASTMEELEKIAKKAVTRDRKKLLRRFIKNKPNNIDEEDAIDLRNKPSLLRRLRRRKEKKRQEKEHTECSQHTEPPPNA